MIIILKGIESMDRNELNAVASSLGLLSENEEIHNNDNNFENNNTTTAFSNNNNNEEEAYHDSSNIENNLMEPEDGLNAMVINVVISH